MSIDATAVEVLHIDDCPGWEIALRGVHEAVGILGRTDVVVAERALRTEAEVGATAFAGSPTILVDGEDLFPSTGRTSALACRIYRGERGLAPAPTTEQIVAALRERLPD